MVIPRIALTAGEPAGIGPELCLQLASQRGFDVELVCIGDAKLLAERATQLGLSLRLEPYRTDSAPQPSVPGVLRVLHEPLRAPAEVARLDPRNARYVLATLDRALAGAQSGEFAALVTAPVQKSIINDAGIAFAGHTEYFAAACGTAVPVMLLVAGSLRVALATTHLPLREVSDALDGARLDAVLATLDRGLRDLWGLQQPRIAVCGLNPHAGEGGHLGTEEQQTIQPAIARARAAGIDARGPIPADTAFVPRELASCDAVLAMYHDQGLPVVKHAGFGQAVNVTLGLPIIRTSVDHGTALDLAGTGRADTGSLNAAIELAIELAARRR